MFRKDFERQKLIDRLADLLENDRDGWREYNGTYIHEESGLEIEFGKYHTGYDSGYHTHMITKPARMHFGFFEKRRLDPLFRLLKKRPHDPIWFLNQYLDGHFRSHLVKTNKFPEQDFEFWCREHLKVQPFINGYWVYFYTPEDAMAAKLQSPEIWT